MRYFNSSVGFESKMEPLAVAEFFPIAVVAGSESKMEPLAVAEFFPNAVVAGSV